MSRRRQRHAELSPADFAPLRVVELELGEPLPSLMEAGDSAGGAHAAALCLVRLHGAFLGSVHVAIPAGGLDRDLLARSIGSELGAEIDRHLRQDGLEPLDHLDARGIGPADGSPCTAPFEELLERAPTVSVVIPTRNRPGSALETLETVLRSNYPPDRYEVIVVDNASGADERVDLAGVEPPAGTRVRMLAEPAPGGSNARNAGLHAATGEIVAFCDDDVLVDPNWIASLALAFEVGDRVGGVAGLTLPRELDTPAQVWYEGFASANRGHDLRVLDRRDPPPDRPLFPFTVGDLGSGENFAFRRELLIQLGGFDPSLGSATPTHGGEDVEAMLRVLLADRQVIYQPRAIVRHAHQRDFEQFERRVWGYGVGLSACLTKVLLHHPRLLPELLRKLPGGLAYALSPSSPKNVDKPADYPGRLTRLELRGIAYGPLAYVRSRTGRRRRLARAHRDPAPEARPDSIRALIITDSYWPLIGGANRSIELLAHSLAQHGHTVAVATAWQEGVPSVEDQGRVRVHRLRDLSSRMRWISEDPYKHNPPPFPDPEAIWRLRRLIKEFKPDIVHSYGWLTHSVAAALLGKRIPLLLSARGYGNICAVHNLARNDSICEGPAPLKCLACSARTYGAAKGTVGVAGVFGSGPLLRRKVTTIHSVSSFVARKMDRYLRVPAARNEVIPNFHEEIAGAEGDRGLLARLPEDPFILYVGAFRRIKGIEELFDAYRRLDDPPPLVLAGTRAPDTPARFPDGVVVVEDVPYPTVLAMWDRAMFGVFPTRIPEALGNVVHEAMSRGRAVIGTRPGGHEDMIDDGENGLLVPAGDSAALGEAMSLLIDDATLRERLGAAALERSSDYTPAVVMPRMEGLYRQTIADHRRPRS
ncbi:MAG TPA: glycosyltransferase [Solirubrobacterales bacterium]|jgi:glycosyltransferase involved in cell wall biosynthesis